MQNMEKVDIRDVSSKQKHLTKPQQLELEKVLEKDTKLFDGTLGVYHHKEFHIEVEPGTVPKHSRPYSVPNIHIKTFKKS